MCLFRTHKSCFTCTYLRHFSWLQKSIWLCLWLLILSSLVHSSPCPQKALCLNPISSKSSIGSCFPYQEWKLRILKLPTGIFDAQTLHTYMKWNKCPSFLRRYYAPYCDLKQILSSNHRPVSFLVVDDTNYFSAWFLSPGIVFLLFFRGRLHCLANGSNRILSSYPYCADTPWRENRDLPRWNQVTNTTRKTERETVW